MFCCFFYDLLCFRLGVLILEQCGRVTMADFGKHDFKQIQITPLPTTVVGNGLSLSFAGLRGLLCPKCNWTGPLGSRHLPHFTSKKCMT